jgi:hypothetical protein
LGKLTLKQLILLKLVVFPLVPRYSFTHLFVTRFSDTAPFNYTIPEPCTLMLLGLGAAVVRRKR